MWQNGKLPFYVNDVGDKTSSVCVYVSDVSVPSVCGIWIMIG